jgi:hypothetical protein
MREKGFDYQLEIPDDFTENLALLLDPVRILNDIDKLDVTTFRMSSADVKSIEDFALTLPALQAGEGMPIDESAALNGAEGGPLAEEGCGPQARKLIGVYRLDDVVDAYSRQMTPSASRALADPKFRKLDVQFSNCTKRQAEPIPSMLALYPVRQRVRNELTQELVTGKSTDAAGTAKKFQSRDENILNVYKKCAEPLREIAIPILENYFH